MKIMLDPGAKMPTRAFHYDAGLDLYAKEEGEDIHIPPYGGSVIIDTGVHVQIPQHFCGFVKSKSGIMSKKVVTDGTIDCNYTGSIRVMLFNHGEFTIVFKNGILHLDDMEYEPMSPEHLETIQIASFF